MRKKIIAANWKMHMTQSESEAFITTFLREIGDLDEVEIVIVPPFTAIPKVAELLTQTQNIKVGARWVTNAPIRTTPFSTVIAFRPGIRVMSINSSGCASLRFSIGTRLCPPARICAESPCSANKANACVRDSGRA